MDYLFGDNTTFPLPIDFLETLRKLIAACVGALEYESTQRQLVARQLEIASTTVQGDGRIDALWQAVHAALEAAPEGTPGREALVARIARETERACRSMRTKSRRRTTAEHEAVATDLVSAERTLLHTLGPLLLLHELPDMRTSSTWEIDPRAGSVWGSIVDESTLGIRVSRSRAFGADAKWSLGSRVSALASDVRVSVPGLTGLLRKRPGLEAWDLGAWVVMRASASIKGRVLLLGRDAQAQAAHLALGVDGDGNATAQRLDRLGTDDASAVSLSEAQARGVRKLSDAVFGRLESLGNVRDGLIDRVTVDDEPVTVEASLLVRRLVSGIAPIVGELRRRSPESELVLKRVVGPGHREELHVSAATIFAPVAQLSPDDQELFAILGHRPPRRARSVAPDGSRETASCAGEMQAMRPRGTTMPAARRTPSMPPVPPLPLFDGDMLSFEVEDDTTATGRILLAGVG